MPNDDTDVDITHDDGEPKAVQPPPGPADHGGRGGMATRENAPELAGGDGAKD